jgi:large repetitive protein
MRRGIEALSKIVIVTVVAGILPMAMAGTASAARVKTIRITDASVVEGNLGSANMSFTVSWTGAKGGAAVTVAYAMADASATAGEDYTATSGTAAMSQGGCHCATITVPVLGDLMTEGAETFKVNLSNPVNGVIGDAQGIGTIYDNEGPPSLVVTDASAMEAAGLVSFDVVLTNPSASPVTVDYATADGSAAAGSDYTSKSNTLTFNPIEVLKTVTVSVTDDTLNEDDETFTLNLSNASGATTVDAQGVGTILDEDAEPDISIGDATVAEGDTGTETASFSMTMSAVSGREVDVDYTTADGTATVGSDYENATGTVQFAPGQTTKQIDVTVDADVVAEADETFTVELSQPLNANIPAATALGTITDDDEGPKLAVDDPTVIEGNSGTTLTFAVSMDPASGSPVTVDYATVDGSATAGSDYAADSGTLTFPAGEVSQTVRVDVTGDTTYEPNETLTVALSNPVGGLSKIIDSDGTGTITNDDKAPTALTLKLVKGKTTIQAKGLIEMAASSMKVKATLYKKKGAKFVRVSGRAASVGSLSDRDGDNLTDGTYVAKFARPARGSYQLKVAYPGSPTFLPCFRLVKFKL